MVTPHKEILFGCLSFTWEMIDLAIEDLSHEQLVQMPSPNANSIAWTLWHMSRVFDSLISIHLLKCPQLWSSEGWEAKFNIPSGQEDRGVGWTIEEVSGWAPPDKDTLIGYYEAVKLLMTDYIESLTESEIIRTVDIPVVTSGIPGIDSKSVGAAFGRRVWDYVSHAGHISYIRGLIVGPGWYIR
tara:strand:- start:1645 stop:2199 length:555 start_codon:yes stop_codon:yes gene_type:complete